MRRVKLTGLMPLAQNCAMPVTQKMGAGRILVAIIPLALAGCVTVEAPSEPIVIELNINIRQEVIYRLAEDAGNTIEDNADIF